MLGKEALRLGRSTGHRVSVSLRVECKRGSFAPQFLIEVRLESQAGTLHHTITRQSLPPAFSEDGPSVDGILGMPVPHEPAILKLATTSVTEPPERWVVSRGPTVSGVVTIELGALTPNLLCRPSNSWSERPFSLPPKAVDH